MRTDALQEHRYDFRAMGTQIDLWLWCDSEARAQEAFRSTERFFARTEARLSRFRASSELSRLNRSAGTPFAASPRLYEMVALALEWRAHTDGIFDPAILPALEVAGYDRSFDRLPSERATDANTRPAKRAYGEIELGPDRRITLPAGTAIDLGGIAKGWSAQQAAYQLGMVGPAMVDAGGDIACAGTPPSGSWVVGVADPLADERDMASLSLNHRVVATSSRMKRRWTLGGRRAHHLIDPRTGKPAVTSVVSVTVVSPRLPDAEIHAKTALILGEVQGVEYLNEQTDASAMMVTDDGRYLLCGGFEEEAYVPSTSDFTERFRVPA